MPTKTKVAKRENTNEIILVLLILHIIERLYRKIADYIKISKLTVTRVLQ